MSVFNPGNKKKTGRKILKIRYPKSDCFCEWQEQRSITADMEIILSGEDYDADQGENKSSNDPFFGHYNTYF
jgi:hypothetical protein